MPLQNIVDPDSPDPAGTTGSSPTGGGTPPSSGGVMPGPPPVLTPFTPTEIAYTYYPVPPAVSGYLQSQGRVGFTHCLELQLINGTRLFVADRNVSLVPLIAAFDPPVTVGGVTTYPSYTPQPFVNWLTKPPIFPSTGTLVNQTATAVLQNVSGDSVARDGSKLMALADVWGALFVFRVILLAAEYAFITQVGQVADARDKGDTLELTLSTSIDFGLYSAPNCEITNTCQNTYQSQQCGTTSNVDCLNSYGSCTQLNRFRGLILQWNNGVFSAATNANIAQPVPLVAYNPRRPA